MTQYWTTIRFNDNIVSDGDRSNMRDGAGSHPRERRDVAGGTAYGHSGSWGWNGRSTTTCLVELPNNVVASIILNSGASFGGCASLRDAYNSSF